MAVYAVTEDTEFINEWGEKNIVSARQLHWTSLTHSVYLTTGWYSFNESTVDVPENIVFIVEGNVNLILPDGCSVIFETAADKSSFSGDTLLLRRHLYVRMSDADIQ